MQPSLINERVKVATGHLTGERVMCGYGERFVIVIDRPLPRFRNLGWNCWHDSTFERLRLDAIPDPKHESNDCQPWQAEDGQFMGTVRGRFTNGETWINIHLAPEAFDPVLKRYTQPFFSVQG